MQFPHLFLLGDVGEVALELLQIVEFARRQEVEEIKQLFEIVLQWRASQKHFVIEAVTTEESEELGTGVLQAMGFVHH